MSSNSKLSISVDKYSGDNSANPDMFINEIDTWIAFNGVTANQQQVMALHLTGAAKEWYYNEFAKFPAAQQSYDELKNKLRARFSRGDENIIARREQHTLRIVRTNPPNFLASVSTFNAAFTRNQVKIKDQGQVDQVMAYLECIRLSIPDYHEVLQLQQSLDTTFSVLAANEKTLSKARKSLHSEHPTSSMHLATLMPYTTSATTTIVAITVTIAMVLAVSDNDQLTTECHTLKRVV